MSLRRWAAAALAALAPLAGASPPIPAFSDAKPGGALPAPWRAVSLPHRRAADVELVADDGRTVLRVRSERAFGTAAITLDLDAPVISWRWKIDRVVEGARLGTREGDDFAARVYVTFEIPAHELTFAERTRLGLTRLLHGDVPSAAICYVWDNRHAKGHSIWSPHAERVRIVVLESGIAAGNDGDQTGESVTAWFGDFRAEPR